MSSTEAPSDRLTTALALAPIIFLVTLLACSVYLFGADSSYGANQIALVLATCVAALVGQRVGLSWRVTQQGIVDGIAVGLGPTLILLAVGMLIGTWILCGTVPAMIYYGVQILDPEVFYAASALICAIVAISIGSSWTVAGTLGIGLMGIAGSFDLSPAITAGAIISGAYFGDKLSPLSDTTNLAPAVVGTDLFTHIRHMAWTTTPSIVIALVIFTVIGLGAEPGAETGALGQLTTALEQNFNLTVWALLPLVVVFYMAFKKVPPLPTILFGALLGGFMAMVLQPDTVLEFVDSPDLSPGMAMTKGVWMALADGFVSSTGVPEVDDLLSRGGMSGMLVTIWLILTAMAFGSVLEKGGMLMRLIESSLKAARSTGTLVMTVVLSAIGINIVAADQYIAIVLPGRMYKAEFNRRGLAPKNLSRVIEDSGTLTSPLVPWNTCGAYMAATLGVATFAYLPFAFFNLINPLISIFYGFTGFTIEPVEESAEPVAA